jgi:S1-C subfamily serine protease
MRSLTLLLALLPSSDLLAQGKNVESVFERTLRSCVFIAAPLPDEPRRVSTGTGSFIGTMPRTNLPVVITNYHVVAPCIKENGKHDPVLVMFPVKNRNGEVEQSRTKYIEGLSDPAFTTKGRIVAYLKNKDLALVELQIQQVPKGITVLGLAGNSPKPGAKVHTIGNTGAGGMWSYTEGSVRSVYDKKLMAKLSEGNILKVEARMIESTNPTNKGDSGGPLVNNDGELVGVTQGGAIDANAVSTFIDIGEVKALLLQAKINVPRQGKTTASVKPPEKKESTSEVAKSTSEKSLPEKTASKTDRREESAQNKLKFAKSAIKGKDYSTAESFLKQIVEDYDDTQAVVEAKSLLEEIRKKK